MGEQEEKKRKKGIKGIHQSLRTQILVAFILSNLVVVFGCWIGNVAFLESFYQRSKIHNLQSVYQEVEEVYGELGSNEEVSLNLERLTADHNISLYIFDIYLNNNVFFVVSQYPQMSVSQMNLLRNRVAVYLSDYYGVSVNGTDGEREEKPEKIRSGDSYGVYKVKDERLGSDYIELFGSLDADTMIYVRSNYESLQESVSISNQFLFYIAIVAIFISAVAMYFLARHITVPLEHLTNVAERLAELDFDAKYEGTETNEIGVLGSSMNKLSQQLESTISELKHANNELKQDIEKRTELDAMRQDFLSGVSHELKTPIALIQGYAEGLRDNVNDDPESRNFYCDVIIDEASRMNQMVQKIMTLNQIEFGGEPVTFERFDLTTLVSNILISSNILFSQKEAKVTFTQKEPVFVWADEFLIEEVITNYISNAVNHLEGEREIRLWIDRKTDGIVRLSVFNSGQIIPPEEQEKIWIKFYKVDKARSREYGGNGIGLSIVKAIMNNLNQECGTYNLDNGVVFWFELDGKQD